MSLGLGGRRAPGGVSRDRLQPDADGAPPHLAGPPPRRRRPPGPRAWLRDLPPGRPARRGRSAALSYKQRGFQARGGPSCPQAQRCQLGDRGGWGGETPRFGHVLFTPKPPSPACGRGLQKCGREGGIAAGVSSEGISEDSRPSRPESKPVGADTGPRRFQDSEIVGSCLRPPPRPCTPKPLPPKGARNSVGEGARAFSGACGDTPALAGDARPCAQAAGPARGRGGWGRGQEMPLIGGNAHQLHGGL